MEAFQEQLKTELYHQEIRSNKYTLKGFFWFFMALALIWLLNLVHFFVIDEGLTTIALIVSAILFLPPLYIYFKGDLSLPWLKYFFLSLICAASSTIAALLAYHAVFVYVVPLLLAIQYRKRSVLWFTFAFNTVTMLISSFIGFYYGLCDLNLLFDGGHPRTWYLNHMQDGLLSITLNENMAFVIVVFEVLPRTMILFVFSILLQYIIISRNEDAYRIAELTYRKETDLRTNLFNKNKYEEMVEGYYPGIDRVAVIFWDLNNLKKVNDRFGHATGDALIEAMSACLNDQTDDRCRVYRIGGDEFLMVIDNPAPEEPEAVIAKVREQMRLCREEGGLEVTSAVGFAAGAGTDFREIVKAADAKMYEDKKLRKEGRRKGKAADPHLK